MRFGLMFGLPLWLMLAVMAGAAYWFFFRRTA
jgi:hypothetical protein